MYKSMTFKEVPINSIFAFCGELFKKTTEKQARNKTNELIYFGCDVGVNLKIN